MRPEHAASYAGQQASAMALAFIREDWRGTITHALSATECASAALGAGAER